MFLWRGGEEKLYGGKIWFIAPRHLTREGVDQDALLRCRFLCCALSFCLSLCLYLSLSLGRKIWVSFSVSVYVIESVSLSVSVVVFFFCVFFCIFQRRVRVGTADQGALWRCRFLCCALSFCLSLPLSVSL